MATHLMAQDKTALAEAITDPQQIKARNKEEVQPLSIETLYRTRSVGATAWSPDGREIAFISNLSGRNNLWVVAAGGGWPQQLTVSDQRQDSPAWSPDGRHIAFISDHDGNEQWDIYVVTPANGQVVNLTNTPDISEEGPAWSPDSHWIAYQEKPQVSSVYEIRAKNLLTGTVKELTRNTPKELFNTGALWSPDGKWIAYTQHNADARDSNVFVVEFATGKSEKLTPHEGERAYSAAAWSPDGKKLLITSDAGNGHDNAGLLEVATKKIEWLTEETWEVEAGGFSPDGRQVTWTANVDGDNEIFLHDLATKQTRALEVAKGWNTLGGAESAFTRDGSRLLLYHNSGSAPKDAWVYEFASGKARQVTESLVAGLRSEEMVEPQLAHFASRDGKFTLSARVYAPFNAVRDGKNAAVVYVHGGPQSQWVNSFNRIVQYLVNQGYFVIAPNYRGSTGYGRAFMDANRYDMGGGDLEDVLATADFLKKTGYVDAKKIAIAGGSYGGYMTMMGVTKAPEEWAAGVAIVPFVNWFTEVAKEDPLLQQYDLATMGDPVKNKGLWEERSPINFVERIRAPLFLLAGGNDPRCPKEETQQVVDAVKKRGGVVEAKIFEDEGHGFARVENQIEAYGMVAQFLLSHVKPAECGCTVK